jgi:hypothetical protein
MRIHSRENSPCFAHELTPGIETQDKKHFDILFFLHEAEKNIECPDVTVSRMK